MLLAGSIEPVTVRAQAPEYRPITAGEYAMGLVGPRTMIRSFALAGFDQWRERPIGYPHTWRGFEDRLGMRFGELAISHTLRFGASRIFEQRTFRYRPCECGDSSSRLAYALLGPLRVTSPTGVHLSPFNPATEVLGGILITRVRSDRFRVGEGSRAAVHALAAQSVGNVIREYWPWRWRPPFL